MSELYDQIGRTYAATRRTDPRIAAVIWRALGDAETVVNVGAGTGAYERSDRKLVAVEPSPVMIAQRPVGAAPVIRARAEELPFADAEFDAAMAILSDHHWRDRGRGLRELRRVARKRVVLFNANPAEAGLYWLTTEYLPGFLDLIPDGYRRSDLWERNFVEPFGPVQLIPVPIPYDCEDGFYTAFWRRPEAYLEPAVRSGISVFAQLDDREVREGIDALAGDLESGRWRERHRDLLQLAELHLGFYVVVAELGCRMRGPKLSGDDGE